MSDVKEKFLGSIFVLIVLAGVVSGSIVFFNPHFDFSASGSPSAFAVSPFGTAQKIAPVSGTTVSAGHDQTVLLNSKVKLEAIVPAGMRVTYFSWQIVSPTKKVENKLGRMVSFDAKEVGKYVATLTYSKAPLKTSSVTVTVLPPVVKPVVKTPTLAKPVLAR